MVRTDVEPSSPSLSPYRDGAIGLSVRCADLEAETKMLRSTLREMSAKYAAPRALVRMDNSHRTSRRERALALLVTGALVGAGAAALLPYLFVR